jgi:tRNA pseudouridine55 synthase
VTSGVLVLDKTSGVTSFDAVTLVRRRLRVRRVGHAGTLDPAATGVLPILIGEATKLMPYLMDQDKEYVTTIRFGVTTDTQDLSGRVVATAPVPALTRELLDAACRRLTGRLMQVPPMYSAVHHEGRRLYDLAREGLEVDRAAREVVVHSMTVEEVGDTSAVVRIVCGKGTYVRVLAADLGAALGCGAAVERLARTRVGRFDTHTAVRWQELTDHDADALWARVLPPESAVAGWPAVHLDAAQARRFVHGQPVDVTAPARGGLVRVHEDAGALLGVGEVEVEAGGARVRPVRLLNADRSGTRVLPA